MMDEAHRAILHRHLNAVRSALHTYESQSCQYLLLSENVFQLEKPESRTQSSRYGTAYVEGRYPPCSFCVSVSSLFLSIESLRLTLDTDYSAFR